MKRKTNSFWRRAVPLIIAMIIVPVILSFGARELGERETRETLMLAERSVHQAAVQCYALEGFYPMSIEYLEMYYGIAIDKQRYFIDYQYVASNLMPNITIFAVD